MAKYDLRIKARELRGNGISVKEISTYLGVSKSSASLWVRDIILTVEQLENLRKAEIKGKERGRLKSALLQKKRRTNQIEEARDEGIGVMSGLSEREFLIAGSALYWGEGSKKSQQVEFCNSDPKMIKFLIGWLKFNFQVTTEELRCRIGINELHRKRESEVKQFWSKTTGIPIVQFNQTSFKQAKSKKVYGNFNEHYGTLSIKVLRPTKSFYKILGLINGLSEAGMKLVFQDVS